MTMNNFEAYGRYYDLLYKDKDYKAEAEYVATLIHRHAPAAKHILELGSGSGNHAAHLCAKGFTVLGVERSESMIELAKSKHIQGYATAQGDISTYSTDRTFDAAISLFHVISYLTDNDALLSCFRHTHRHLNDVWYTPAVYTQQPVVRIKRLADAEFSITRIAEPVNHYRRNVIDVNFEVNITHKAERTTEVLHETHPMRHFSEPEVGLLAEATGFEVIAAEEFQSGATPGPGTWGVCFILKKKTP
jgi:SAM-dependent methyltransferase